MKKVLLIAMLFVLAGCATLENSSVDWIPIGPEFSATKAQNVEILSSAKDITRPYTNVGLLRIKNLKPDRETLKMGVEKGRKIAASKGADAILLGQYNSASDGAPDPRVGVLCFTVHRFVRQESVPPSPATTSAVSETCIFAGRKASG